MIRNFRKVLCERSKTSSFHFNRGFHKANFTTDHRVIKGLSESHYRVITGSSQIYKRVITGSLAICYDNHQILSHNKAITASSMSHQRVIRESSESHQRVIRESSEIINRGPLAWQILSGSKLIIFAYWSFVYLKIVRNTGVWHRPCRALPPLGHSPTRPRPILT